MTTRPFLLCSANPAALPSSLVPLCIVLVALIWMALLIYAADGLWRARSAPRAVRA